MKKLLLIALTLLAIITVSAQQYAMYQTSKASLTFLDHDHDHYNDVKLEGALITISYDNHKLEIKTALPFFNRDQESGSFQLTEWPIMMDLEMNIAPDRMQRYLTSERVFSSEGILKLNNIPKSVSIQYSPFPFDTENNGQMRMSFLVAFNISNFFPYGYPDELVAFAINNGYVNRK